MVRNLFESEKADVYNDCVLHKELCVSALKKNFNPETFTSRTARVEFAIWGTIREPLWVFAP